MNDNAGKRGAVQRVKSRGNDEHRGTELRVPEEKEMGLSEGIALLNAESDDIVKLTSALEKTYNVICYLYKRNEHAQQSAKTKVTN